ncbi:phosphate-starvation-inducible E, partial [Vibrio xuii]
MPSQLPPSFSRPFLKIFHVLEALLLVAITLATVFAMVEEFIHMYEQKRVLLTDILLMFIYLEVLAMVQQFVVNGKIPVRYPIYIAMMA